MDCELDEAHRLLGDTVAARSGSAGAMIDAPRRALQPMHCVVGEA
jgi:hypothetical protein